MRRLEDVTAEPPQCALSSSGFILVPRATTGRWSWADPDTASPAGHANASFCPHGYGCRTLVLCEGQAVLDVTDPELTVTVRVPEGRWLWLVSPRTWLSRECPLPATAPNSRCQVG